MKSFLRKVFGIEEVRPGRGDTRATYWKEPTTNLWNWHCQDGNNEIVCGSNQGYTTEAACLAGIDNAREALYGAVAVRRTVAE